MNQIQFQRELFVPSTIDGLNECLEIVCELTKQFDLDLDASFSLRTVIVESVENAIIHGNKLIGDSIVRVLIMVSSQEISIEVEDRGEGFDVTSVPSPLDESAIQNEGGRGIFFIKSLSLSVNTMGRGNIIRIKLKR